MRKLTSLTFISTAVLSGMLLTNSNIVKADTANTIGEGNSPAVNTQTTSNSVSDNKSTSIDSKQTTKATDTQTKSNGTDSTSSNQPTDQTKENSADSTDSKKATDTTETKHQTTHVSFTASTDSTETIFNNNNYSVAQSTYNGIVHATGFANADSNTLSTSAAILNVEKSDGKFNIVEKLANTTDKDAYVDFYIAAPSQANTIKAVIDSSKMSGFTSG